MTQRFKDMNSSSNIKYEFKFQTTLRKLEVLNYGQYVIEI